jgi:quercetin dioxygenase-like cupin family protein
MRRDRRAHETPSTQEDHTGPSHACQTGRTPLVSLVVGEETGGVRRIEVAFADERGTIADILDGDAVNSVTIITSRAGAVRGNHYHQVSRQYVYVVSGRMRVVTQVPGHDAKSVVMEAGDLALALPNERHAMEALDDTVFIVLTSGPRAGRGFESDTWRLGPGERLLSQE